MREKIVLTGKIVVAASEVTTSSVWVFFSGNNNFISCSHSLVLVDQFATSKVTIFGSFGVNSDKVSKEWRKTGYTIWPVGIR